MHHDLSLGSDPYGDYKPDVFTFDMHKHKRSARDAATLFLVSRQRRVVYDKTGGASEITDVPDERVATRRHSLHVGGDVDDDFLVACVRERQNNSVARRVAGTNRECWLDEIRPETSIPAEMNVGEKARQFAFCEHSEMESCFSLSFLLRFTQRGCVSWAHICKKRNIDV